jgi:uncharacterized protein
VGEAPSRPDFKARFLEGIAHFNAQRFWEAHESWEELWLAAQSDAEQFLQGLIQLAAAYHHVQRGTLPGALRLFDAALGRLSAFPPEYCGIRRAAVEEAARRDREWAARAMSAGVRGGIELAFRKDRYPEIMIGNPASMPPCDDW